MTTRQVTRSAYRLRLDWPPRRWALFGVLVAAFVALSVAVLLRTSVIRLDHAVMMLHLKNHWHTGYWPLRIYVMLGQRGPSTLLALPWFVWLARRNRSLRPLVTLGVALVLLNLSVGALKLACGRIGPLHTNSASLMFAGGDIYPSGHVANAVVLYGVIAALAVSHRRFVTWAAVFVCVTIGLSTVYLRTHWLSDVVGGWLAGAIVLLAVPVFLPPAEAGVAGLVRRWRLRRDRVGDALVMPGEAHGMIAPHERADELGPAGSVARPRRTEVSSESTHG